MTTDPELIPLTFPNPSIDAIEGSELCHDKKLVFGSFKTIVDPVHKVLGPEICAWAMNGVNPTNKARSALL